MEPVSTSASADADGQRVGRRAFGTTLRHVARVAGVHPSTASRALDPGKMWLVKPETRARVQAAARELGYRADIVARNLRRGQTTTVGVAVADLGEPSFAPVLRGIADALERHGFAALISETRDDHERLRVSIENLLSRRVDGMIVTAARAGDGPVLDQVVEEGVPVVLAVRSLLGSQLPSVTSNDIDGGHLAAIHLAALGHELVAELAGPHDVRPFADRSAGFARTAAAAGIVIAEPVERAIHPTPPEGRRLMELLLTRDGPRPTALFAHNDSMAIGALAALRAAGLGCPDDISILGYNDAPLVDHIYPPLSTIRFPSDKIGRFAADIAMALIEDPRSVVGSTTFPPELVVRESTAPRSRRRER